jgi:hypothetical protein
MNLTRDSRVNKLSRNPASPPGGPQPFHRGSAPLLGSFPSLIPPLLQRPSTEPELFRGITGRRARSPVPFMSQPEGCKKQTTR